MFGKINHHAIRHHVNNAKHHIVNGYFKTKNALQHFDNGMAVAKRFYTALAPILEQHQIWSRVNSHALKALGDYENVRNKVVDVHHQSHRQLARHGPDFNF